MRPRSARDRSFAALNSSYRHAVAGAVVRPRSARDRSFAALNSSYRHAVVGAVVRPRSRRNLVILPGFVTSIQ